jgi:peroxiredoxin
MTSTVTEKVPQVGDTAPDFTLTSTSGEKVSLSSFRGQRSVLLAFFPLAFTSTCTSELCAFTDDFDAFTDTNVQILPISVDATPSLKEFRSKYNMKVDLLSDFKREASRAYGVLREDTFYAKRSYFLIDKEGIIRWAHIEDKPGMRRENSEILQQISLLENR